MAEAMAILSFLKVTTPDNHLLFSSSSSSSSEANDWCLLGQHKIGLRWVKVTDACKMYGDGVGAFQIYKPC
jgi:hypothetical protein